MVRATQISRKRSAVRFPVVKSPLYLTKHLLGGQLPPMLWRMHVGLSTLFNLIWFDLLFILCFLNAHTYNLLKKTCKASFWSPTPWGLETLARNAKSVAKVKSVIGRRGEFRVPYKHRTFNYRTMTWCPRISSILCDQRASKVLLSTHRYMCRKLGCHMHFWKNDIHVFRHTICRP